YQPCASPCGDRKTKPGIDSLICRSPTVGRTHRRIVVTGCHIVTVRICSSRWASRRVHRSGERVQTYYVKPWPASLGCSRRRQPGRLGLNSRNRPIAVLHGRGFFARPTPKPPFALSSGTEDCAVVVRRTLIGTHSDSDTYRAFCLRARH